MFRITNVPDICEIFSIRVGLRMYVLHALSTGGCRKRDYLQSLNKIQNIRLF